MTLVAVPDAEAERLFTVVRDGGFGWTVAEIPDLMASLGWVVTSELPGEGAIADTRWAVPGSHVSVMYQDAGVRALTISATNWVGDDPADRLAVVDAFASLTATGTKVLGPPTARIPDTVPRVKWRLATATVTIQNGGRGVLITWFHNEYQDFNDSVGRF